MAQRYLFPGFDFNGGLPGAREARDKALEQVAEHSGPWMAEAMRHMRLMPDMWEGTGEEFRLEMLRFLPEDELLEAAPEEEEDVGEVNESSVMTRVAVATTLFN